MIKHSLKNKALSPSHFCIIKLSYEEEILTDNQFLTFVQVK